MLSRYEVARLKQGFTLIELMVTIAVVAILAVIALPSFARVIASNRVVSGINEFVAATNHARTEAIRRGRIAGVCASNDGKTCAGTWNDGFLVYYYSDIAATTLVPIREGEFNDKDTVNSTLNKIEFTSRGASRKKGEVLYKPVEDKYKDLQRCLYVSSAGSITTKQGEC